ncbi:MAG: MATE family efflux transporter [Ideonella sp.]|nr:MATE family efflux transporter [Ideonella sp.]
MTGAAPGARAGAGLAGFADSLRRILPLAWPVFVGQVAVLAFGTVDTVLASRSSPEDLAALAVGAAAYITVFIGLMGIVVAVGPIVGQLYGAGRLREAGHQLHQAAWIALALSALGGLLLLFPRPFIALSGVSPEVEWRVRAFLAGLALALPAALLFAAYRGFNTAVSRPKAVMVLQLGGLALKVPLAAALVFGLPLPGPLAPLSIPALGVAGCGLSTAIVMWGQLAAAGWLLRRDPFYRRFELGRRGWHRPDRAAIAAQLRLGVPMGASILIEVTSFAFMAIFIARLGTTPVAGHQIAVNLVSLLFMMPMALGNATCALVAQQVGAGDAADARRLGWHGIAFGVGLAAVVGTAVFALREPIVGLYTTDTAIAAAVLPLLGLVVVFHVFDALQAVVAFVLRAWRIATVPMLIYAGSLWLVGLGGGYRLAFDASGAVPPGWRGAMGFWIAATAGLVLAGALLLAFLAWVLRERDPAAAPFTPQQLWSLAAAIGITVAALVGSLAPSVPMPQVAFGDKLVHAAGYAALAIGWQLALRGRPWATWLGVAAFGVGIECLQGLLPWRSFQWLDMVANGTGAALGLAVLAPLARRAARRV